MRKPPRHGAGRLHKWCRVASCRAPYAGVSRVRFQGALSTPILGVPLAVHEKDTRAGLHRKLSEMAAMVDVAMAYVVEVSSCLPGGENERIGFAEGELGIQGDHVHESQA